MRAPNRHVQVVAQRLEVVRHAVDAQHPQLGESRDEGGIVPVLTTIAAATTAIATPTITIAATLATIATAIAIATAITVAAVTVAVAATRHRRRQARIAAELMRVRVTRAYATTPDWTAIATAWDGATTRSSQLRGRRRAIDGVLQGALTARRAGAMQTGLERCRPRRDAIDHRHRGKLCQSTDFTGLARAVSPRSAWRPPPLVAIRCARACGDIRSSVTGSLCGGVAEPARRGRRDEAVYGARRGFATFERCRW